MIISSQAETACNWLDIDPATLETRYLSGADRVVHEYRSADVCQHGDSEIFYMVRETSQGDGLRLDWVLRREVWEEIEHSR